MSPSTIPWICGVSLAVLSAAGASHWWSVNQFIAMMDQGIPAITPMETPAPAPTGKPPVGREPEKTVASSPAPSAAPSSGSNSQDEFFQSLLSEMRTLRNENRDLLDQMAETNRDLMKLEFRVDTHSESFRPLPVGDDRLDTGFGDDFGVLPPRAEPIRFPFDE